VKLFAALVLLAVALLTSGCSSLADSFRPRLVTELGKAPEAIERSERELAEGKTELALRRARDARAVRGLSPELRDRLELLIERIAAALIEQQRADADGASRLAELVDAGLPKQLSVAAGIRAARIRMDLDQPFKAYRLLRKLEEKFPRHHGRAEAGAILAEAGLKLADDPWSFLFFNAQDDGLEILEYLVLTYPSERRCDEAFAKLAQVYEQRKQYGLAIQRHEELLFSHGGSPLASASQARIPHLRLLGLESPEYDRTELLRARRELEAWLTRRTGDAEEAEVRLDYADCLQRLVQSDMGIARYYRRIDRPYGARYHAERALRLALDTGDERLTRDARKLLASIPEVSAAASAPIDDDMFSADSTLLRTTLDEQQQRVEPGAPPPAVESQEPQFPQGQKP
jgi:hypothetical protein